MGIVLEWSEQVVDAGWVLKVQVVLHMRNKNKDGELCDLMVMADMHIPSERKIVALSAWQYVPSWAHQAIKACAGQGVL